MILVVSDGEPLRAISPDISLVWESGVKYVIVIETAAGMAGRWEKKKGASFIFFYNLQSKDYKTRHKKSWQAGQQCPI